MAKKEKLPGDIARIIKTVGKTAVNVKMTKGLDETNTTLSRDQYSDLMKCELVDVPTLPGFYLVDRKLGKAKLLQSCTIDKGLKHVTINGIKFNVNIPFPGVLYGK